MQRFTRRLADCGVQVTRCGGDYTSRMVLGCIGAGSAIKLTFVFPGSQAANMADISILSSVLLAMDSAIRQA
jgi:hypothetical protein